MHPRVFFGALWPEKIYSDCMRAWATLRVAKGILPIAALLVAFCGLVYADELLSPDGSFRRPVICTSTDAFLVSDALAQWDEARVDRVPRISMILKFGPGKKVATSFAGWDYRRVKDIIQANVYLKGGEFVTARCHEGECDDFSLVNFDEEKLTARLASTSIDATSVYLFKCVVDERQ